jgi:hypothetical protein
MDERVFLDDVAAGRIQHGQDLNTIISLLTQAGARVMRLDRDSGAQYMYNLQLFSVPDDVAQSDKYRQLLVHGDFALCVSFNENDTLAKLLRSGSLDYEVMMTHSGDSVWLYYNAH